VCEVSGMKVKSHHVLESGRLPVYHRFCWEHIRKHDVNLFNLLDDVVKVIQPKSRQGDRLANMRPHSSHRTWVSVMIGWSDLCWV